MTAVSAPPTIGHVHLWVSDLGRAIAFYRDVLGMEVTEDMRTELTSRPQAFLAFGNYHNHVALRERKTPVSEEASGLHHFAVLYPSRLEMARALRRILDRGYPIANTLDYGVSEVVNLHDPDGNGIELTYDRPAEEWPRVDGQLRMYIKKVDRDELLAELEQEGVASA